MYLIKVLCGGKNGALSFDGVKLFVANGLGDNKAVAAEKSNLFFGTGLLSDHNEVKLIDMADLDGLQCFISTRELQHTLWAR